MPLEIGSRLAHYEIISSLGAGGMGEVYRAKDTKLGREVAIKLLLDEVSANSERVARFEREARVLASLNHKNIATLHGFETDRETSFLVMELVEGETLADRIARGPMPIEVAIQLFVQIAEGLEAAHEKGVIHRDLKPANVKVLPDGGVKILDFGLAKALSAEDPAMGDASLSASPTLTLAATQRGEILGTAAYMSPEQASGKSLDRRTDVWAFGVCLFEALSGRRAFAGEDAPNTLAAVLRDEPDLDALPAQTPPRLRRLLRRCFAKSPIERLRDIGDARLVLLDTEEDPPPSAITGRHHGRLLAAAVGFGAAAILAMVAWVSVRPPVNAPGRTSFRLDVKVPEAVDGGVVNDIIISPDGARLAYVVRGAAVTENVLYVRDLAQIEGRQIASGTIVNPFFSPDGMSIAFFTGGALEKVSVNGGSPVELAPGDRFGWGAWSDDGSIVFQTNNLGGGPGLGRVSADGGEVEMLTRTSIGGTYQVAPQLLPGDRLLLFTEYSRWQGANDATVRSTIEVLDLETLEQRTVLASGFNASYVPTGHLVFMDEDWLFVVAFDLETLETRGVPVRTSARLFVPPHPAPPSTYSFSDSGTMAYLVGSGRRPSNLVVVGREGTAEVIREPGLFAGPRISPDGSRLLVVEEREGNVDVWLYDLARGSETRLTFDEDRDDDAIWSRDGEYAIFNSNSRGRSALTRVRVDGSGEAELLYEDPDSNDVYPTSEGPDGALVFGRLVSETAEDVFVLDLATGESVAVAAAQGTEEMGSFSPDGRWIAYSALDGSGAFEVFVRPYPPRAGLTQITQSGGRYPRWSADGRELFFSTGSGVAVVSIETDGNVIRPGAPEVLFEGEYPQESFVAGEGYPNFDVFPDGQRFVVTQAPSDRWGNTEVRLVTDWFEELERLAPTD